MQKKLFLSFVCLLVFTIPCLLNAQTGSSVYGISFEAINGNNTINLSDFEGKKILVVNTASFGDSISQLTELVRLADLADEDKLMIIVCPSNSFGREPGSLTDIRSRYNRITRPGIVIAAPMVVAGEQRSTLYSWLGSKNMNGVMNGKVFHDFNKFLISENGSLIGFFGKEISPTSPLLVGLINGQN